MKAIILAAGRGSRMNHLTDDRPKCLLEFKGRALLDWQISALSAAGIREIGIVTGYRREMLANRGLTEFHNPRWSETNMVTSLTSANDWLSAGPCIVSYSDIFYDQSVVDVLQQARTEIAISYDPNWLKVWAKRFDDPLSDAETFKLGEKGRLVDIGGKPDRVDDVEGQYMGVLRFTPKGWEHLLSVRNGVAADSRDLVHMTGMLRHIISVGNMPIEAVAYNGPWGEIDSISDLAAYQ